jgi:predicted Zn-dependent protease
MRRASYKWAVTAFCLLALGGAPGCRTNPVTGLPELTIVSPETELALGDQMYPNVIFMYDGEYRDPELKRYLGTIVMRLNNCSHRPDMPADFTVLNTSVVNAFATPGHVYASRGFVVRLENEAEFASAMGHELAHVAAGHTAKELTTKVFTGLALDLADYAGGQSAVGRLVVGAGQASGALLGLSYSREQEIQADRVGTYYMALAGWDPRQAIAMQRLLDSLGRSKATVLDKYLSTHPPTKERIRETESVIYEKKLSGGRLVQGDGIYAARWARHTAQVKEVDRVFASYDRGMKALADGKPEEALQDADEAIQRRGDQAQFYRLRGDALQALGKLPEAKAAYGESLRRDPRYVPANNGLGRALLRQSDWAAADAQFAVAAHGYPNSLLAWYGLGLARYKMERYGDAAGPLEKVAGSQPDEPTVRYMLAVCCDKTGRLADAHENYRKAVALGLSGPERQQAISRASALQVYPAPASP